MSRGTVPSAVPADTSPDVWRRQVAAVAAMSPQERLDRWVLNQAAFDQVWQDALRRRHPEYDDLDVVLAATRRFHGDALVLAAWPDEPLRDW
ncbi:MAG TPA: hypothetical protein VNQ73_23425 [Ilumatobacter sp.]|nr:hypothetical protein [Ilumatobacter sp.]